VAGMEAAIFNKRVKITRCAAFYYPPNSFPETVLTVKIHAGSQKKNRIGIEIRFNIC
jgi:hypothetical protein